MFKPSKAGRRDWQTVRRPLLEALGMSERNGQLYDRKKTQKFYLQRKKISCIVGYVYNRLVWKNWSQKTGFPASRVLSVLTGLELERTDQGSSEESLCKDGFEDYRWLNI